LKNYLLDEYKNKIIGETDSEIFFYLIIQSIEKNNDIKEGIKEAIEKIDESNIYYSGLNFLLTDGNNLYAFRYSKINQDYYSLYYLDRNPLNYDLLKLESEETKMLIQSKRLNREYAVLVCSEKLTEEKWISIGLGELLIINKNLKISQFKIIDL